MKTTALVVLTLVVSLATASAQQVVLVRPPQGILQPIGAAVQTETVTFGKIGTDRVTLTLATTGPFTVSPASLTLVSRSSATSTLTPNTPTVPFYNSGILTVAIAGTISAMTVPVRLAAVNPPAGRVEATAPASLLTAGLDRQTHQGSWSISNLGSSTLQGILTADVPWLAAQSDIVNVPARGKAAVSFNIDPTRRNAFAPLGALAGKLSLLYATGGSTPVARVSASVLDITKVAVGPGAPPAPVSGETITFLPVFSDQAGVSNEIFFANRGSSTLTSDLRLYYTPADVMASQSLAANAGPLGPTMTAWFPLAPSSLFAGNATGSVQLRSSDPDVAAAVNRISTPDSTNVYTTATPVLRSDRAVGAGDRLVFAGIEKSATASTDIFLQETAGIAAAYTIDFYDALGGILAGSRSGTVPPFGAESLRDVAPADARSARVTNSSTSAARLAGFAAVVDASTADEWTIVDNHVAGDTKTDLVLPLPAGDAASSTFSAWITNSAPSPVVVAIGSDILPPKSRVVRRNPNGATVTAETIVLGAGETREVPLSGAPFVHVSGPAGAITATGRLTTKVDGRAGAFGTGVPAIPVSLAAAAGAPASHFFRALDQLDVEPMTLMLVEVAKKSATVRVTAGFTFPAGASTTPHLERSRDFDLAPGEFLSVPDLLRAVVPAREAYGDLINVAIDVQVVGGDGRVLAYVQSVNTSGDLTVTAN